MHFQSPVVTFLGRNASFDLALDSAALLGVGGEAASPPIYFIPTLWRSWLLPIGFLFLQGEFQHLGYLPALDSQPFPIWKVT